MTAENCLTCRSVSGGRRISPGPVLCEGEHWMVEHAYPVRATGWLVIVLKRHAEALHELTDAEFAELARLQAAAARVLQAETGCAKEYLFLMAEKEGFHHVHVHLVARAPDLAPELKGTAIFKLINVDEAGAPREEIRAFCERLRANPGWPGARPRPSRER